MNDVKFNSLKVLSPEAWLKTWLLSQSPEGSQNLLMYSSYWNAFVDDPRLMLIPMEDHLVHRGDGVFEAFKIIHGKIYLLKEHLNRLELSSRALELAWPMSRDKVENILNEMVQLKKIQSGGLRIFLSRGMGTFSANPYDSKQSHFHFVLTNAKMPTEEKYNKGVQLARSQIAPKVAPWSGIKSCNYLPNVLMKKEAIDLNVDFTVGYDEEGFLTECSTENLVIVNEKNQLCRPTLKRILKGTTMMRTFELAQKLVATQELSAVLERNITEEDLVKSKEAMIIGTTWDVLAATSYQGKAIGDGKVGSVAKKLLQLLREDQQS